MEYSYFFNADNGDRMYDANDVCKVLALFIGDGVYAKTGSNNQIVANGSTMNVVEKIGSAWISGHPYMNTTDLNLKIENADGVLDRIDLVVLRLDNNSRSITCNVKKGTFASSPSSPVLQRDADAYELGLAQIYVKHGVTCITQADITDLRLNNTYCGIVHGVVDQVSTESLFNQYQSWLKQKQSEYDGDFTSWVNSQKGAFDEWYAGKTNEFVQQFQNWYTSTTGGWETNFNTWFDTIKDILTSDVAGGLASRILTIENGYSAIRTEVNEFESSTNASIDNMNKTINNSVAAMKNSIDTSMNDALAQIELNKKIIDNTTNKKYDLKIGSGVLFLEEVE